MHEKYYPSRHNVETVSTTDNLWHQQVHVTYLRNSLSRMVQWLETYSKSCTFQSLQNTWCTKYDNKRTVLLHWNSLSTVFWLCKHFDQTGFTLCCCYEVKVLAKSATVHKISSMGNIFLFSMHLVHAVFSRKVSNIKRFVVIPNRWLNLWRVAEIGCSNVGQFIKFKFIARRTSQSNSIVRATFTFAKLQLLFVVSLFESTPLIYSFRLHLNTFSTANKSTKNNPFFPSKYALCLLGRIDCCVQQCTRWLGTQPWYHDYIFTWLNICLSTFPSFSAI